MTKILVIDDEDNLRESIAQILTFEGFEVVTATNGVQGINLVTEQLPDLVISDITMPEIDGYQVILAMRNNPLTASIPLIFLTARTERPFMRHGMELGADDYVTKPFTNAELLAAVRTRLDRQQNIMDTMKDELTPIKQRLGRLISHELRTPLASITMVQELMSKQWGQMSIAQIQDLLDMMRLGSQRLSHLVEQTVIMNHLDSSLISEKEIRVSGRSVEIWSILNASINLSRRFAYRNADAIIKVIDRDRAATVQAHPYSLTHGIAEIIANALAFSPENTDIVISQWQADHSVWISILDTGTGISTDQIDYAMREFEQIDREKREQQGLGLGLPLANRIIEAHGGDLKLSSIVGKGTQVVIQLPSLDNADMDSAIQNRFPITTG